MAFCVASRARRSIPLGVVVVGLFVGACSTGGGGAAARKAALQSSGSGPNVSAGDADATTTVPAPSTTGATVVPATSPTTATPVPTVRDAPPTTPVPPRQSTVPQAPVTTAPQRTTTPVSAASAATGLGALPRCGPTGTRTALADLSWSPARTSGSEQKVQLTTVQNGFENGAFESSPSLSATASAYTWPKVNPSGIHTWRVVTLQGSEWVPSETSQFTGPVCVSDIVTAGG